MTYYSFIQEAEYLEEGKIKSTLTGILALLGSIGASSTKLPAAYVAKHPGETTFGRAMLVRLMKEPDKKVDYAKEFTKGFNWAKGGFYKVNPAAAKTEKFGDAIVKTLKGKSSIAQNASDTFHGKVSL